MDTVNYKCPNCSAGLAFDSKSQKMETHIHWKNWNSLQSSRTQ